MSAGPAEIQTRTILPARTRRPQHVSPPRAAPLGGDELRVRAWLWAYFGIGSHTYMGAGSGQGR